MIGMTIKGAIAFLGLHRKANEYMSEASQKNYLFSEKPDLVREWHPTKNGSLTPRNVTTDHRKKVWWLCENGHEWETAISDRIMGEGCPFCVKEFALEKNQKDTTSLDLTRTIDHDISILQNTNSVFQTDYRKYPRYKYKATAILEDSITGNLLYAQMQNIGKAGMYLEANIALKKGNKIEVKFNKPLPFTKTRIFPSTVRWCNELHDDEGNHAGYASGVKFTFA
jgi:hypothetical protein